MPDTISEELIPVFILVAAILGFILAWVIRSKKPSLQEELKQQQELVNQLQHKISEIESEKNNNEKAWTHELHTLEQLMQGNAALLTDLQLKVELLEEQKKHAEELLEAGQPVIHSLKLKLIEANNTISRYKGKVGPL